MEAYDPDWRETPDSNPPAAYLNSALERISRFYAR